MSTKTAFLTGGASGIGAAVTQMLFDRGVSIAVADRDIQGARSIAQQIDPSGKYLTTFEVDVASWESQAAAFQAAVKTFGRIDYVFPIAGIGEKVFFPNDGGKGSGFVRPDLSVVDVDLNGFLYTAALGVQQMRRQEPDGTGVRGRIIGTASICGFYCVPTLPVYTAAKHGVVGFVRSYGKYLPEEQITMNAICPNVLRTNIMGSTFYDNLGPGDKIVDIKDVVAAFESLLDTDTSGECLEVGPNGGFKAKPPTAVLDTASERLNHLLYLRSRPLQLPDQGGVAL